VVAHGYVGAHGYIGVHGYVVVVHISLPVTG
jgi:hypothetical protein